MARTPLGAPYRVSWKTYQTDGTTLVNAGANSLVVRRTNADGTTTNTTGSPYTSPANDGTGLYHQDVSASDLATAAHYAWVNTSTGAGAGIAFGDFDVFDPFEPAVLPLADAKDGLNIAQSNIAADNEIALYLATIESSLEAMTGGPILNTTITERAEFSCDMQTLQPRQRPLVSVTSIVSVPNGATVDISAGLDIDPLTNIVRTKGGWPFSAFSPICTVTYVAGWGVTIPAAFNRAASIILDYLWTTQHGPSARPSMGGAAMELTSMPGFSDPIPAGAAKLLRGGLNGLPFTMTGVVFA